MLGRLLKRRESSATKDKEKDTSAQVAAEATDNLAPASSEVNKSAGQEDDAVAEPVPAEGELSERQADEPEAGDKNSNVPSGVAGEEGEEDQEENDEGSLFKGLFDDVAEKEETSVDRLIDSLPDISVHELLDEMEEVSSIIQDWHRL